MRSTIVIYHDDLPSEFYDVIREIVYRKMDGYLVRALAFYSYRSGPFGRWELHGKPLSDLFGKILLDRPYGSAPQISFK